jgi:hypothetical protein
MVNTNTYRGLSALLCGYIGSRQVSSHSKSIVTPKWLIVSFSGTLELQEGKYSPAACCVVEIYGSQHGS